MRRALPLLVLVLGLLACSTWERGSQEFPGRSGKGLDHDRWTRDGRLYKQMETVGLFSVTALAPVFQDQLAGLVVREAGRREPAELLGFALPQTEAALVLIVSGPQREWETFGRESSPWTLALQSEGESLAPSAVHRIDPPVTFERFFPAWNPWSRAWLLTFPLPASAAAGTIRLEARAPGPLEIGFRWP